MLNRKTVKVDGTDAVIKEINSQGNLILNANGTQIECSPSDYSYSIDTSTFIKIKH
jgi:hypothetical protein